LRDLVERPSDCRVIWSTEQTKQEISTQIGRLQFCSFLGVTGFIPVAFKSAGESSGPWDSEGFFPEVPFSWFFQGHPKRFFQRRSKMVKFHFTHSTLKNKLFRLTFNSKISNFKIQDPLPPVPLPTAMSGTCFCVHMT